MADLTHLDHEDYDAEEERRRQELAQYIKSEPEQEQENMDTSGHVRSSSDERQSESGGSASYRSAGSTEPTSATKEEYLLGEDKYGASYLDDYEKQLETQRKTGYRDSTRWGKSAEQMFDEQKLNLGSYLDTHEKMKQMNKNTTFSDQTRWGKSVGEIYDETKFQFGSYLEQQQRADRERAERETRLKAEAVAQLKKDQYLDPDDNIFKYEELKGQFPKGVDPVRKEEYLSDEEFEKVFGITYDDYMKLGAFRRKQMKKKVGLF